jgi:hypothetical protein
MSLAEGSKRSNTRINAMKKRKPPWVLMSALVIVVGSIVIVNASSGANPAEQAPPPAEAPVMSGSRESVSKKDMSQLIATAEDEPRQSTVDVSADGKGIAETPTILLPKVNTDVPTPSDSSISNRWYDKSSRLSKGGKDK